MFIVQLLESVIYIFCLALKKHGIAADDGVDVLLFDHTRTPLDAENFAIVVNQYRQSDVFCVTIEIDTQGAYQITKDVRHHIQVFSVFEFI